MIQSLSNSINGAWTPILLLLLAVSWYMWLIFFNNSNRNQPPLPPGPRSLPLVGNLPFLDPELHTYFADLAQTHGPIFKLWLGRKMGLVLSSPAMAREVLKEQDSTFANRDVPVAARVVTYGGEDIVWTPNGTKWRMLRRVCVSEMLSKTTLDGVYSLRRVEMKRMIRYIHSRVGSQVNIGEEMFLTMLNVITNMLWGGTVEGKERESVGSEFREVVGEITNLIGKPNLSDFYPGLARFDLQGIEKEMKVWTKKLDSIFEKMIDKRKKMVGGTTNESKDFLQFLLQLKEKEDEKMPLTITSLKALLMDMVVGGTDTTSNAIEFAMAEIMNKPKIMTKIKQELDLVVGKDKTVEESHIQSLPYLYATMKESLRLHPTLPLLVPHCPNETSILGGFTVPRGSRVFVNVWAIHRDPTIWENPLEFDPERFLDGTWDYSGRDFNYFPFGSGRRICAGLAMAERMFMFALASLLHSFDWELAKGEKLDLSEKFGIVLKKKIPLVVVPTPRLSNPALYD